jgi:hypothetical protein
MSEQPKPGAFFKNTGSISARSRKEERVVPAGWGRDSLTGYFEQLEEQSHATFVTHPELAALFAKVDALVCQKLGDIFHEPGVKRLDAVTLFMRSWSIYGATLRLLFAGQLYESQVLMRAMLECSVYAWACWNSEELTDLWNKRDESPEAKKAFKRPFQWVSLMQRLEAADSDLATSVRQAYETLIDQGAHPNPFGVQLNTAHEKIDDGKYAVSTHFSDIRPEFTLFGMLELYRCLTLCYALMRACVRERLDLLRIHDGMNDVAVVFGKHAAAAVRAVEQRQRPA